MMIGFWFDFIYSNEDYYCGYFVIFIDKCFRSFYLLVNILRIFRGLKFRCYWKVLEFRFWLFFYFVLVMYRFLGEEYF